MLCERVYKRVWMGEGGGGGGGGGGGQKSLIVKIFAP